MSTIGVYCDNGTATHQIYNAIRTQSFRLNDLVTHFNTLIFNVSKPLKYSVHNVIKWLSNVYVQETFHLNNLCNFSTGWYLLLAVTSLKDVRNFASLSNDFHITLILHRIWHSIGNTSGISPMLGYLELK